MRTSHQEGRPPAVRHAALVLAAVALFALLLPVGATAAGQLVSIVDPNGTTKAHVDSTGLKVDVANPVSAPAAVSEVYRPFKKRVECDLPNGQFSCSAAVITVPAGTRLVIDTVSGAFVLPTGQKGAITEVVVRHGTQEAELFIPLQLQGTFTGTDEYVGTEEVQAYANAGDEVSIFAGRSVNSGQAGGAFSVFGHLVRA